MRFLEDVGFLYVILGLLILSPLIMLSAGIIKIKSGAIILAFLQLSIIFALHSERKDKGFLRMLFKNPLSLFITEYILISIPFFILPFFTEYWYMAFVALAVCICVPFFNISYGKRNFSLKNIPFVPASAFEWKSGLRRNIVVFVLFWLGGAGLSFLVGAVPVALILLNFVALTFYMEAEHKTLIEVFGLPPSKFLAFKIKQALFLFWMAAAPLVILFLIFHLQYWYVMAYIVFAASSLLIFGILQKYAFFEENTTSATRNSLLVFFAAVAFYVPHFLFLLPVMLMLLYRFYKKSLNNLSLYLYAFHS